MAVSLEILGIEVRTKKAETDIKKLEDRLMRLERAGTKAGKGVNKYGRAAQKANKPTKQLTKSTGALTSALKFAAVAAVALGARAFVQLSDEASNLTARLNLVSESSEEAENTFNRLVSLSNETRASMSATATIFNRMAQSTRTLGLSTDELLSITKTLNQTLLVSGTTTAEATSTLLQFSQAISAGALMSEEFRAVAENNPRLMQALSESLKVTRGELKKMASQGLLTNAVIFKALAESADEIDEQAKSIPRTIGQAAIAVQNKMLTIVKAFNDAIGANQNLVNAIEGFSNFLGQAGKVFIQFGLNFQMVTQSMASTWDTELGGIKAALVATLKFLGGALANLPLNIVTAIKIAVVSITSFFEKLAPRVDTFLHDILGTIGVLTNNEQMIDNAITRRLANQKKIFDITAAAGNELTFIYTEYNDALATTDAALKRVAATIDGVAVGTLTAPDLSSKKDDGGAVGANSAATALLESTKETQQLLLESFQNDEEMKIQKAVEGFEMRQLLLEQNLELELITRETFNALTLNSEKKLNSEINSLQKDFTSDKQKFMAKSGKDQVAQVLGDLQTITQGAAQSNKALFQVNKIASIGMAIVNTANAVTKTLAEYPAPLNFALAGAVGAAGAVQVATIAGTSFGSGSAAPSVAGGSIPGTTTTNPLQTPVAQESSGRDVTINVQVLGNVTSEKELSEIVFNSIKEDIEENDNVLFNKDSAQAFELTG